MNSLKNIEVVNGVVLDQDCLGLTDELRAMELDAAKAATMTKVIELLNGDNGRWEMDYAYLEGNLCKACLRLVSLPYGFLDDFPPNE